MREDFAASRGERVGLAVAQPPPDDRERIAEVRRTRVRVVRIGGDELRAPLPQEPEHSAAPQRMEQRLRADLHGHAHRKHGFDMLGFLVFEVSLDMGDHGGESRAPGQLIELADKLLAPRRKRQLQQKMPACAEAEPRQLLLRQNNAARTDGTARSPREDSE